jgi:hypothetical protein
MSPHDTDLIEITIQTLVALDTLLRLLKSRREALDLLQGRLLWEERRKDCWTTYVSLKEDLDDLVKQARWSPQIYQKAAAASELILEADEMQMPEASTSEWSPITNRSASGLTTASNAKRLGVRVKTQSIALQSRCRSFVDQVVPLAGKQLDELIELRQLPDAFLDEQDRLEDLAESIKEVEVFMIQLSVQWRKADEIFRQLRSLHIQGKQLSTALAAAQREVPSEERLAEFSKQRDSLNNKMVAVCGAQTAQAIVSKLSEIDQLMIDCVQQTIPEPTSEAWPDQDEHSRQVQQILAKEMTAAAKHVRSAYHSTTKYEQELHLFKKSRDLVSLLKDSAGALQEVGRKARSGWTEDSDPANDEEPGRRYIPPDFNSPDCLIAHRFDSFIEAFPSIQQRLNEEEQEANLRVQAMKELHQECTKGGLLHSLYRRETDEAIREVNTAQSEARAAVEGSEISLNMFGKARTIALQMTRLDNECEKCLNVEATFLSSRLERPTAGSPIHGISSIPELQTEIVTLVVKAEEAIEAVKLLMKELEVNSGSGVAATLYDRTKAISEAVKVVRNNLSWLETMEEQRKQLTALQDRYTHLTEVGLSLKAKLLIQEGRPTPVLRLRREGAEIDSTVESISLRREEKDNISAEIEEYVKATHSDVILCGPMPHSLAKLSARPPEKDFLPAIDEAARQSVNQWCSLLSSLTEGIQTVWQEAEQRQRTTEEESKALAVQQVALCSALSAFGLVVEQAKKTCNAAESSLESIDERDAEITQTASLDRSIEALEKSFKEVLDTIKRSQCSPSLEIKLESCKEEVSLLVNRAQNLERRLDEQRNVWSKVGQMDVRVPENITQDAGEINGTLDTSHLAVSALSEDVEIKSRPLATVKNYLPEKGRKAIEEESVTKLQAAQSSSPTLEDKKQRSDPLPMPVKRTLLSKEAIDDVFGSAPLKATNSMPQIPKEKVSAADIRQKVKALMLQCTGDIVEEQIQPTGKSQFKSGLTLPTTEQAEAVKKQWKEMKTMAKSIVEKSDLLPATEADQLRMTLQLRDAKVRRFVQLAAFNVQQTATEEALSRFLDVLDQSEEADVKEQVQKDLIEVTKSISQANLKAEPVLTDLRVRHQLSQLRHSYQDMAAIAREACKSPDERGDQDEVRSTCPSRSSSASSLPSLSGSGSELETFVSDQRPSLASSLMGPPSRSELVAFSIPEMSTASYRRKHSSSSGTYATASQRTPRQSIDRRVVSEGIAMTTPSRLPITSSRSNAELSTPRAVLPRPSSSSSSISGLARMTTRTPQSVSSAYSKRSPSSVSIRGSTPQRASSSSTSSKPNQYRANPRSKLDVAVGKIVNKLPMQVNITHASMNPSNSTGSKAKEEWQDESGRYWVGQPDPKLCFCRILRSRAVMVRVGGGWQELTTYILKHFSHLGNDSGLSVAASPHASPQLDRGKTDKLPWISSATLLQNHTPTGKVIGAMTADLSPESAYLTPVHERDEQGGSASFRSARRPSTSAKTTSPSMITSQFEKSGRNTEDMHGLWIRRERKTSHDAIDNSSSRIPSWTLPSSKERDQHHTRSTLASRNRKVSSGKILEPRRRVESLSVRDENSQNDYTRIRAESTSIANSRRVSQPRDKRLSPTLS